MTLNPVRRERRRQLLMGALAAIAGAPFCAAAEGLSSRPVRFLLAQTPATTPDVIARLIAPRFQQRWNQSFIVENRAGAAGAIGMETLARAAPDGHTMQVMPSSILTLPIFFPNLPFDILRSFQPVSLVCTNNFALVAHASVPASNVREFIAYARAHPGMNYGSAGNGTSHHLFMEQLRVMAGLQMTHVPYKGSAPAFNDLLGGQIPAMFMPIHVAVGMAKDGRVRVLGGSMRERSPLFPDLASLHEQGVAGFQGDSWFGLWGPAGLPVDIVAKYGAELRSILAEPELRESFGKQGIVVQTSTPDEMARHARTQMDWYEKLIRAANIKAG
ncbi:MAG: tripartite tricarboxylate transporter substrate binding protein [Betaproteobacteria bacterium]|nr:tripartite tricarboxylate transporter substrate binding protein [Betaproteobacteria bacterium]